MNQAKKAVFEFVTYEVSSFSFKKPLNPSVETFSIGFAPSGIFSKEKSEFRVILGFNASYDNIETEVNEEVLSLTLEAVFSFDEVSSLEEIPDYFYRNSLGIIFPYLRAFVSTMTFQANFTPPMLLPILNLTTLEQPFRENITVL